MPNVRANGIQIEYDTFGDRSASPLLLVMGLGAQLIAWDEEFCELLAARGYYVIRFDNRDVGLSTKFDADGLPDVASLLAASLAGQEVSAPYNLDDMADDAAGLLDALDIETAHAVGASMGGMIVQALAIRHPARVLSLTSIMSTTGHPDLPQARPEALGMLLAPPATDRDGAIAQRLSGARILGSPAYPVDVDRLRESARRSFDRCFHPVGVARQMVAILASGSRREALRSVRSPTLVIHGRDDPLVPVEGGIDTAAAVPGAELMLLDGMGHDLPVQLWQQVVDAICANAARATA